MTLARLRLNKSYISLRFVFLGTPCTWLRYQTYCTMFCNIPMNIQCIFTLCSIIHSMINNMPIIWHIQAAI